jgi:hypothetical protein
MGTDVDGDVGDFSGVIGEVDIVCMAIGMKNRIFYNCRASGIKMHTRRMLHNQLIHTKEGEKLEFFRGRSLLGGC